MRTTNRNGDSVQPQSRLIIPGHLDPQIGTYRTDAPATSLVAVQSAVMFAVSLSLSSETCDVSPAFLSGMPIYGSSRVRAPSCGLPSVGTCPELCHGQLLQILKGCVWLCRGTKVVALGSSRASGRDQWVRER